MLPQTSSMIKFVVYKSFNILKAKFPASEGNLQAWCVWMTPCFPAWFRPMLVNCDPPARYKKVKEPGNNKKRSQACIN